MKLRQKLAAVLATAMIVTSVPVVTMASSKNTITRPSTVNEEGKEFDITSAPALRIEFDSFDANGEEFYLKLTNADFTDEMFNLTTTGDDIEITKIEGNVAKVNIKALNTVGDITADTDSVKIPLLVKLKGGIASVEISAEGSGSTVTEGSYVFANTSSEVATVTAGSAESISGEGKIGTITISEAYAGSMRKASGNNFALIELNNSDFEFNMASATRINGGYTYSKTGNEIKLESTGSGTYTKYSVPAKYTYGFAGATNTPADSKINVFVSEDNDHMYVEMPNNIESKSKGKIELNGLYIESTVKTPAEGNITVDVTGNVAAARDLVVAVNGNYGAVITIADEEKVSILAGETEKVNFTIKEAVKGTFTNGRKMDVKLSNGYIMDAEFVDAAKTKVDEDKTLETLGTNFGTIKVNGVEKVAADVITAVEIEDEKVVGFTINPGTIAAEGIAKVEFEFDLLAGIEDKGEVTVSVAGRDFDEAITGVIAEIRSAVEMTSEQVVLKTGLMGQVGGKITITESEAGALNRSELVSIKLPNVKGINFNDAKDKLPEVKVTAGDVQVSDVKIVGEAGKDQAVQFTIKRDSKAASTIEISNFHIDTDRTVAEGTYDVELGGKAITSHDEAIEIKDFIKIGTANTEDLMGANGLMRGTSTFVVGESKYTVNGVEKQMDGCVYIQQPGYTMVPVRFVAEAFGVTESNVMFANGVATFFAGSRTIQLTNNSDVAVVNGVQIKMATKVAIKDGRTYAPIGEVAQLLGISKDWDNTTKTAVFTNK